MSKKKKKEFDLTEIDEKMLEEISKDDEFKMQLEIAKKAVKEVASTEHIDSNIEMTDEIKTNETSFDNGYFDKGPNKQQIIDYFEKENISFSRTQIDKLFDTKEEIDRLRIENKRLESVKSELEFLLRRMDTEYSSSKEAIATLKETVELQNTQILNLEGEIKNKELHLVKLTNSLTEKNKELIDKAIYDYNVKLEQKESEIVKLKMELDSLNANADLKDYKENLLRLRQIEAITEELLTTVSKYPKVYDEYKATIVRVAPQIRNIKV